jgi:hypothetical protein
VEEPRGQDVGRLAELREDARHAHAVGHERLPVGLEVGGIQGDEQLVSAVDHDEVVARQAALAQLVVQLEVRLRHAHPSPVCARLAGSRHP